MTTDAAACNPPPELLDVTALARRHGFLHDVRIARELFDCAGDEGVMACLLRAAADALLMRRLRLHAGKGCTFAIEALRAPTRIAAGRCRLSMRFDDQGFANPTITLRFAG